MTAPMKSQSMGEELGLRPEVGLAGLEDELRDVLHRLVGRGVLQLVVDDQTEGDAERRDDESELKEPAGGHAEELDGVELRRDGQRIFASRVGGEGDRRPLGKG